jgi:probable DNA repair protein
MASLGDRVLVLCWDPIDECTPHAARGWNVSLGGVLADEPMIAAALTLIALAHGPVPVADAAALLRSAWLPGADAAWLARSAIHARWLESGRDTVGWGDVVAALEPVDGALAARWLPLPRRLPMPRRASPREWAVWWQRWLDAAGWPGERSPDHAPDRATSAATGDARGAWDQLLAGVAALETVEARVGAAEAGRLVATRAAETPFQPESAAAGIQILGLLEAIGLPFDALWVTGMAADAWPPAPQPNPLLPLPWQRERGVPHADAARELAYARKLTDRLLRSAPGVVVSWPLRVDDRAGSRSPLLPAMPLVDDEVGAMSGSGTGSIAFAVDETPARRLFAARPRLDPVADRDAPPLASAPPLRTGIKVITAQSECPFQALAAVRWAANPWPEPLTGLTAMERGTLVHEALEAFWDVVGTQARLVALAADEAAFAARIDAAAGAAIAALRADRREQIPAVVIAGERQRLARTVRDWLRGVDCLRPPFTVRATEMDATLALPGLDLRLRFDRVDALDDGGVALIDYKSGSAVTPGKWFEDRPQALQLALYTLAQRAAEPEVAVRAVAYAQLKPGAVKPVGLAADEAAWPGLVAPEAIRTAELADWGAVEAHWARAVGGLAADFVAGSSAVSPRNRRESCERCGRQALCRVAEDPNGDPDDSADGDGSGIGDGSGSGTGSGNGSGSGNGDADARAAGGRAAGAGAAGAGDRDGRRDDAG